MRASLKIERNVLHTLFIARSVTLTAQPCVHDTCMVFWPCPHGFVAAFGCWRTILASFLAACSALSTLAAVALHFPMQIISKNASDDFSDSCILGHVLYKCSAEKGLKMSCTFRCFYLHAYEPRPPVPHMWSRPPHVAGIRRHVVRPLSLPPCLLLLSSLLVSLCAFQVDLLCLGDGGRKWRCVQLGDWLREDMVRH